MTSLTRDRLLGGVLLAVSIVWLVAGEYTIPEGYSGSSFAPRTFPMALGFLLLALSVILLVQTFLTSSAHKPAEDEAQTTQQEEIWSSFAAFGFLIVHFLAMQVMGFALATAVVVAAFLVFVLKKRSVPLVAGMSLGLAFGIWLLMGRLLGVALPTGINGWGF